MAWLTENPVVTSILISAALVGCSGKSSRTDVQPIDPAPQVRGTTVQTEDGTRFFGFDAGIDIAKVHADGSGEERIDVNFATGDGRGDIWTALFRIHRDALPSGTGTATIKKLEPMAEGVAWVERQRKGQAIHYATGTITYEFSNGRLRAQVTTDSPLTSGTIDGAYQIRCNVPPEELGDKPNGTPTNGIILVQDVELKSDYCSAFKF
jgi:hypothetical protein